MNNVLKVGAEPLKVQDVYDVAKGLKSVSINSNTKKNILKSEHLVSKLLQKSTRPIYGLNTGFGSLKSVSIPLKDLKKLQQNLVRSHAVGVGETLNLETTRAMMLLRVHVLAKGYSGVRQSVIDTLISMLNHHATPLIPSKGSVGASGDLAPLAHLAATLMGEGKVWHNHRTVESREALKALGLKPIVLEPKEALALINGTQLMCAIGALTLQKIQNLLEWSTISGALSLEGIAGSKTPFEKKIHALKPHHGQQKIAADLMKCLEKSQIIGSHTNCDRVQDPYSFRCMPQVHGIVFDTFDFVLKTLCIEMNSVTDNPLVFSDENELVSGGNFHGQAISSAFDFLSISLTTLATISERRTFRLLDPTLTGLPVALVENGGLQSGLMMLQVVAASLVNECRTLCYPSSVGSISTWQDQEDHVSMGVGSAQKLEKVFEYVVQIIAIENMVAAQAIEFRRPLKMSPILEEAHAWIRSITQKVKEDRMLSEDEKALAQNIDSGLWKENKILKNFFKSK